MRTHPGRSRRASAAEWRRQQQQAPKATGRRSEPASPWRVLVALLVWLACIGATALAIGQAGAGDLLVETPDGPSAGCDAWLWPHPDGALLVVNPGPCGIFGDGFDTPLP